MSTAIRGRKKKERGRERGGSQDSEGRERLQERRDMVYEGESESERERERDRDIGRQRDRERKREI